MVEFDNDVPQHLFCYTLHKQHWQEGQSYQVLRSPCDPSRTSACDLPWKWKISNIYIWKSQKVFFHK